MSNVLQFVLHIDIYLLDFVANYGMWTYLALFLVIFAETGLIVTPFLPGDSLLFALGSLCAQPKSTLNVIALFFLLIVAAALGNQTNYTIGRFIGPRVFKEKSRWFLNQNHLTQTRAFYNKHGGVAVILSRFLPILRTFVPFVAGVSYMHYGTFTVYNLASAITWVGTLLGFGYFLGAIPIIKNNFSIVIYAIITISMMPAIIAFIYSKVKSKS